MKHDAEHYEQQALNALSAAYTSGVNEEYNLRAAQVYATLAVASATEDSDALGWAEDNGLAVRLVGGAR